MVMTSPKLQRKQYRTVSQGTARAFVFLALFAVLVAAAAAWFSIRAVQGEIRAKASVVQLCQAGNDSRAQQLQLWTHLIQISAPPPHQTPAQQARREKVIREFLAYVHQVFAPRNCTASFKG